MSKRVFITVTGIVQGVGFRPFVYNLAVKCSLKGWVNNNSQGVYIDICGEDKDICNFINELKLNPPPLSKIDDIKIENREFFNFDSFTIKESQVEEDKITLISPDMAICSDCLKDIHDKKNRRYRYAFTNCTNCGPRFSIIKSIPYDRDKTTMKKFKMCTPCHHEYTDPTNRRFHAQPNACSVCGPYVFITDNKGNVLKTEDPLLFAAEKLKEGKILGIKGLGGFHLACDASSKEAVELLRKRKNRPEKPFAVMAKDIDTVKKFCRVNEEEEKLLEGSRKPIVLLQKRDDYLLPEALAPSNNTLGVMLPYTPLHEVLFFDSPKLLVMTSANISGLPLEYENDEAISHLSNIVDYFVLHNRDIYIPVDDSVAKIELKDLFIIRRARGYAPLPIKKEGVKEILACGPNMKNTFAVSKSDFIFLSSHIGDLENLETFLHYKRNVHHLLNIFSVTPSVVVADKHPLYMSTNFAEEYAKKNDLKVLYVQHHHAHMVSCMVENNIKEDVLGIIYDGTGYGDDGCIWGGEFLIGNYENYKRVSHLSYIPLQGGDNSVKEPVRTAIAYIYSTNIINKEETVKKLFGSDGLSILKLIKKGFNCINTSSMGRLFDAVSAILNICKNPSFDGEASIKLEYSIGKAAKYSKENIYEYKIIDSDDSYIVDTKKIIEGILYDINILDKKIIAKKFHDTVISFTAHMAAILKEKYGIKSTVLSGGVFQNSYLLNNLYCTLTSLGFKVYLHHNYPTNDGGISLGQIVIGNELIKK